MAERKFNLTYCRLLHPLEETFTGGPEKLGAATGMMYALKAQAQGLMDTPGRRRHDGRPTFEYAEPGLRR
ncbi:hypothetical protein SRB17_19890 [Streptomyces sp. RB17]|uniref:hypothetical protein n=1 Tax=Streptomyces sp. RB17 TaxID=2585197 RepID=UPI001297547F|nr:hypothetical protein [Streptomyces sp. RB17]MQY34023.1 hypothetical protein [Streptomyces sp. RB17]